MKKIFALFAALILAQNITFAACIGTKCNMEKVFKSWEGKKLDDVIDVWGFPDKQQTIAGHNLYIWSQGTYKIKNNYGTKTLDYCTRIIEIDSNKTVLRGRAKGKSCPSTGIGIKKWINPDYISKDK